ncbi:MAG: hypothetical protein WCD81_10000 [Candidatus Bathyarchaeia archaeon]
MSQYKVRNFRRGDEEAIVKLFDQVYEGYGGYVPRTVEYWRWSCLQRPDVKEGGVFVVSEDEGSGLLGYAVVGSSGNIWEFCVADGEKEAARVLLAEAVKYLEGVGVSSVSVNVPCNADVAEVLVEAGFGEVPAERMFVTSVSPAMLVQAFVGSWKSREVGGFDDVLGFRLRDVPFGVGGEFSVKARGGAVEVGEGFPSGASVVVEMGFMDFLSVLFKGSSAGRLFLAGKMRVKPFRKFGVALRFLSAIRLTRSWFFPLSDFG